MQSIYVDESGSITAKQYVKQHPYFVISVVRVLDEKKLGRAYKRFISSNLSYLKEIDKNHKMFDAITGKFLELKGCALNLEIKNKFLDFFCQGNYFEVYYIVLKNKEAKENFRRNKARSFNYLVKIALEYYITKGYLPNDEYFFHIDERNIKTEAKFTLEDYLNTELLFNDIMTHSVKIQYCDSCENKFIQLADVFANIYYSNLRNKQYDNKLKSLKNEYIRHEFIFPNKGKNKKNV